MFLRLTDILEFFRFLIKKVNPKVFVYIKIYRNKLEMVNLNNGKILTKSSFNDFSSNRLLIAYNLEIESLGKEMLNEIVGKYRATRNIFLIIHPIENEFINVYPTEKMMLNDFGQSIGGNYVQIIDGKADQLTSNELSQILEENIKA
jgi:hypothetical protein